jgi:hypothetical protein
MSSKLGFMVTLGICSSTSTPKIGRSMYKNPPLLRDPRRVRMARNDVRVHVKIDWYMNRT